MGLTFMIFWLELVSQVFSFLIIVALIILLLNILLILIFGLKEYLEDLDTLNKIKKAYILPFKYIYFFDNVYIRILRFLVGLLTLFFLFNLKLKNRFDLISWFIEEKFKNQNYVVLLPLFFISFCWCLIFFDLLLVNLFYPLYKLPLSLKIFSSKGREKEGVPLEANLFGSYWQTISKRLYL
jgi:hypothetical protein